MKPQNNGQEVTKLSDAEQDALMKRLNKRTLEGVNHALQMFIRKHKLKTDKGATGLDTHWIFAQHVIGEFGYPDSDKGPPSLYPYPFKDSFQAKMTAVLMEAVPILAVLIRHEEEDTIDGLMRLTASATTLDFLEGHKDEVIAFYKTLANK